MRRIKKGKEYFVVPGGGVRDGEDLPQALKREIREETNMSIKLGDKLCVLNNSYINIQEHYYLVNEYWGDLKIVGPEALRQTADNVYELVWQERGDLEKIDFRPGELLKYIRI